MRKTKTPDYQGLHLWEVNATEMNESLWILTSGNNMTEATRKAQRWLRKNDWRKSTIKSVTNRGTIDA